jgi:membrane protein
LDHLIRAGARYVDHSAYQYAASISFFSVLSFVPMLMVALSVAGLVLAREPIALKELREGITASVPPSLSGAITELVNNILDHQVKVGLFGLAVALYSGWNWMNTLRDGLTAMWDQERRPQRLVRTVVKDVLALLGLLAALLVSFALTATGGALGAYLLRLVGLDHVGWVHVVVVGLSVLLAIGADWLVFLWVLARLPRRPVPVRFALRGALAAAVGFEALKQIGGYYLQILGRSPTGVTFGWVVGLLVFSYLVARLVLLVAAWTAGRAEDTGARAGGGGKDS